MGRASGMIGRGVATSIAVLITLGPALADVTTERGSSIILFPKVLSDSAGLQTKFPVETIIQITNTSNSLVFAHCFYVRSTPDNPSLPPSAVNPPEWTEIDFDIVLTKQQPTHWLVGPGRRTVPNDQQCSRTQSSCNDAGFDPGLVPPTDDPFVGYLVCLEVDNSGAPINGNRLQGEATLVTPKTTTSAQGMMPHGEVSKYNAIGIQGLNTDANSNDSDLTLCLGGGVRPGCPGGAEYNACPQTVIVNHFAENATDPVIDTLGGLQASNVQSELTLVPCTQDFETQTPVAVIVQFTLTNEFETLFSTSTTITCWNNFRLDDVNPIFDVSRLGTRFVQTQIRSVCPGTSPGCVNPPGVVGVLEEFHRDGGGAVGLLSRAALNLHGEGERPGGDVITVPEGP